MTSEQTIHVGYVLTSEGKYLVQVPSKNEWGFSLCSDDQSWPGGFGIATEWEIVHDVPAEVRENLGWILDELS